jgi:hypothetical protein
VAPVELFIVIISCKWKGPSFNNLSAIKQLEHATVIEGPYKFFAGLLRKFEFSMRIYPVLL